jgi:hypothetical protein
MFLLFVLLLLFLLILLLRHRLVGIDTMIFILEFVCGVCFSCVKLDTHAHFADGENLLRG